MPCASGMLIICFSVGGGIPEGLQVLALMIEGMRTLAMTREFTFGTLNFIT
jgi:hypothetical protein